MTLFSKKTLSILGLFIIAPITANAATVDINAKTNTSDNPVELFLTAGTYNVNPFEGVYESWNAWGRVKNCNGDICGNGWINNYSITTPTDTIFTSNRTRYRTADLALLNALSTSFTLSSDATVKFYIRDSYYRDNIGGISLDVSADISSVPVPAAAFLFAPALLGFMGLRRKAKNAVA